MYRLFILLLLPFAIFAGQDPVSVRLITDTSNLQPGTPFYVGVHVEMDEGWHIYGQDPGDVGIPTEIEWQLPEGYTVENLAWPQTVEFTLGDIQSFGYGESVTLLAQITPPSGVNPKDAPIGATISWVACNNECLPGDAVSYVDWNRDDQALIAAALPNTPAGDEMFFTLALGLAFLGGILLNLMPCVLPVISVKIMSFVHLSGQSRKQTLIHGGLYALGILLSFWVLAGLLLLLQHSGEAVGWGFHLQNPAFVSGLIILLFLLGLNLFGLFEITMPGANTIASAQTKGPSHANALFSGLLTTLVATPCTGPFLGSALGYAVTLPAIASLAIFTSMGAGLAAPYVLLSAFPSLLVYMPKPGNWMIRFKQGMGFLMMASVLWLAWVFAAQVGNTGLFTLLAALLALSIACWCAPSALEKRGKLAWVWTGLFLLAASSLTWQAVRTDSSIAEETHEGWEVFSPTRVTTLRSEGTPLFIDFTAKWCMLCQFNRSALISKSATQAFEERGVVRMEADWTRMDPQITNWLKKYGRSGVPLYVLYDGNPNSEPIILPQTLTPGMVAEYVETHVTETR